ncbi:o-succinylbenzoate--CoA ligase [Mechercharimyces sp. CAU 1602]|uniref:o-succinylbenzoate--CoA ligase n=1 Tax=Mechercharimyces sp. CAU 1602 TaxID=2973933 RepID=UPI0021634F58|nr:o-succinylbenzoate--CoA ligase [Mechercharimyces sp. CAU 1602]MCS1351575.1 o-succinylbenzoate--CoA ligase [Mechercharimyces sp. CAU 1602]
MLSEQMLPNWLKKRAHTTPDRIAMISDEGRNVTFEQLHERVSVVAAKLAAWGIAEGDRVALLMGNKEVTVECIHALAYLGAVVIPLNTRLAKAECLFQVRDAEATFLITDDTYSTQAIAVGKEAALHVSSFSQLSQLKEGYVPIKDHFCLDEVFTIMYTSGTTGDPKGVQLTYGNHWWSAIGSALNLGLNASDRWLVCVPLFHMSGFSILMRSVIYGMGVVLHPSFDVERVHHSLCHDRISHISVVSTMIQQLLDHVDGKTCPNTLRCVLLGGGPAPTHLLERCRDKELPVYQTYGMTETASQMATLAPEDMMRKLGSAGKPLFPAELCIVKEGEQQPVGQAGEIAVRGPNVMKGYWNHPKKNREVFQEGWFYTGDIGKVDEEGFLYVLDRRKDLIISGGENIYPAQIEAIISQHPAVHDVAVVAQADKHWGQVPIAFVSLYSSVEEEELRRHCAASLASYKVPKEVRVVSEIPRNASNKIMRHLLVERLIKEEKR